MQKHRLKARGRKLVRVLRLAWMLIASSACSRYSARSKAWCKIRRRSSSVKLFRLFQPAWVHFRLRQRGRAFRGVQHRASANLKTSRRPAARTLAVGCPSVCSSAAARTSSSGPACLSRLLRPKSRRTTPVENQADGQEFKPFVPIGALNGNAIGPKPPFDESTRPSPAGLASSRERSRPIRARRRRAIPAIRRSISRRASGRAACTRANSSGSPCSETFGHTRRLA